MVVKIRKISMLIISGILILTELLFAVNMINGTQSDKNVKIESDITGYKALIKSIYNENKSKFDAIAKGFFDKYEKIHTISQIPSEADGKLAGQLYMENSRLTIYEYVNYEKHIYGTSSGKEFFDFTDEQIDALYYVFDNLDFQCIEFYIYSDEAYNLFIRKGKEDTSDSSSESYFIYGIAYSSNNSFDEYYHEGDTIDEGWKYAHFEYGV